MRALVWVLFTLGATTAFGLYGQHNLANFRPVSNDEVELMAVAYKLANQGVLGSDMYAGFFGADQHQLWTLPVQFALDAASFKLFGPGVPQARGVSLLAAVAVIGLTGWLAYRWYGLGAAALTEVLLMLWPSNLTASEPGIPLLSAARVARYDILALAFAWATIALLDGWVQTPRRSVALLAGLSAGLAVLSQFFGAFVLPVLGAAVLRRGRKALVWAAVGAGAVVVPWLAYCARYASDLAGQLIVYGGDRGDFLQLAFYAANILSEPRRFAHILQPVTFDVDGPLSPWLLVVGAGPALAYLVVKSIRGDRLLLGTLVCFAVLLLALEQTKVPLYAILLVPSICVAFAASVSAALRWAWRRTAAARITTAVGTALLLGIVVFEGFRAYQTDFDQSSEVTAYLDLGRRIDAALPDGARVLGPERWWWALHEHPYLSLRSIWFQWTAREASTGTEPDFLDWVAQAHADVMIENVNVRDDVRAFPPALQHQFTDFLNTCTTPIAELPDANYFETTVYQITCRNLTRL